MPSTRVKEESSNLPHNFSAAGFCFSQFLTWFVHPVFIPITYHLCQVEQSSTIAVNAR